MTGQIEKLVYYIDMIERYLKAKVISTLQDDLVAIVYGARQVGKTTLVKNVAEKYKNSLYLDCDIPQVTKQLTDVGVEELKTVIGNADLVIIDEAQRVKNIGLTAKIIHDLKLVKNLILTGSSSFDLSNKIKEPLTGRSVECFLEPLSILETSSNKIELISQIPQYLLYGSYPAIFQIGINKAIERLLALSSDYLYKDAFYFDVKVNVETISNLLQLLSHQIGSEVSYRGLADKLEINKETVMRYISLLENAFIIYRFKQYKRNQRTEVGRLRKVYFYDLGIRNGLINNFEPLEFRSDIGGLWENFVINERRKSHSSKAEHVKQFYYRSKTKKEIDLVEIDGQKMSLFDCKYRSTKAILPKEFIETYGNMDLSSINRDNFSNFI